MRFVLYITPRELLEKGLWKKICELNPISLHINDIKNGIVDIDEELDFEIIKKKEEKIKCLE